MYSYVSCQLQFTGDHHCPWPEQFKAKLICDESNIDLSRTITRYESGYFFHKAGFKAGQVLYCLAFHYHLDTVVYVKYVICKTHRDFDG